MDQGQLRLARAIDARTYPVSPEFLNLIIRDDKPVIPVHCADHKDQNVAGDTKIRTSSHHQKTQQDLKVLS